MELRHLRYFLAVADTGNLSRAAEKLFVAQPPLSLQIRHLEQELGTPLFVRHPKGMRLTPAGEALVPEVRRLLEHASRLLEVARDGSGSGTLRLGIVPSSGGTVVPALVRELRAANPGLDLRLDEMISDEQHQALLAGRIDAGLARTGARHRKLRVAASLADPLCLALPASRAPEEATTLDLRAHAHDDFVAFTRYRGPAYFDRTIRLCSDAGFSPRIRHEASTLHGVLDRVRAELGIALVPASAELLEVPGVALRRLRQRTRDDVLSLLLRRDDRLPLLDAVAAAVERCFAAARPRLRRLTR